MAYIVTIIVLGICITAMALGLILRNKKLERGCSVDPDSCACRKEGKDPCDS